jgi:hypothetical protein
MLPLNVVCPLRVLVNDRTTSTLHQSGNLSRGTPLAKLGHVWQRAPLFVLTLRKSVPLFGREYSTVFGAETNVGRAEAGRMQPKPFPSHGVRRTRCGG